MRDVTLVVNAGGDSRRMGGVTKALLPMPGKNRPLIASIIHRLAPLATDGVIVVANDEAVTSAVEEYALPRGVEVPLTVVSDEWPDSGSLGGVATALRRCREWAMVVACDMPFVNPSLFRYLAEFTSERGVDGRRRWDLIAPRAYGFPQMMHTFYHVEALPVLQVNLADGNLKLLNILPDLQVRYVEAQEMEPLDPGLLSLTNVNTPTEWEAALEILGDDVVDTLSGNQS